MNDQHTIVFYNVENLFDPFDDPNTNDDEFTQDGTRNWTINKYQKKLYKIASVFQHIESKFGKPLFMGLCEVENSYVLKGLIDKNNLAETYNFIHYDSKDERGIDVALLYNKHEFLLTHSESIFVDISECDQKDDFTRDILYVNGMYQNELQHIFVVHFPSKRENDINRDKRIIAMRTLRTKINELFEQEEFPSIVVMGDFNENPDDKTISEELQVVDKAENMLSNQLFSPNIELFAAKQFSLFHNQKGLLFDQFLLSKKLLNSKSALHFEKSIVLNDEKVSEWERNFKGKPFRTYVGKKYLGGYSDHFPIVLQLSRD